MKLVFFQRECSQRLVGDSNEEGRGVGLFQEGEKAMILKEFGRAMRALTSSHRLETPKFPIMARGRGHVLIRN